MHRFSFSRCFFFIFLGVFLSLFEGVAKPTGISTLDEQISRLFGRQHGGRSIQNVQAGPLVIKSGTLLMLQARQASNEISSENQFVLRRPQDEQDPDYYGLNVFISSYDTPQGHFKIHYTEDTTYGDQVPGSDGNRQSVPEFVLEVANAFEKTYSHILSLGFSVPANDNGLGGDYRIDIYIVDLPGGYGYTMYESTPEDAYIVIDNDFKNVPENLYPLGRQAGALLVTAAHELFHIFQLQITTDIRACGWFMEASAVWMEDEVFPDVKDYLNYVGLQYEDANANWKWDIGEAYYLVNGKPGGVIGKPRRWFDVPDVSLTTYNGSHEYGSVLWVKYLSENFGESILYEIWELIGSNLTPTDAIKSTLSSRNLCFAEVLGNFFEANLVLDYRDKNLYPLIQHEIVLFDSSHIEANSIAPLASKYYRFIANKSEANLEFFLRKSDDIQHVQVRILAFKDQAVTSSDSYDFNLSDQIISFDNFSVSGNVNQVVVIIFNTGYDGQHKRFEFDANIVSSFHEPDSYDQDHRDSENNSGCFINSFFGVYSIRL